MFEFDNPAELPKFVKCFMLVWVLEVKQKIISCGLAMIFCCATAKMGQLSWFVLQQLDTS